MLIRGHFVSTSVKYRVFQKELYNDIPTVTVWLVLRKRLHLEEYKLSIIQHIELSQVELGVFCYIMAVQNTAHAL
jgi:hypothetical protein